MINNLPLRLTTLHFAQRLRIDGDTFIIALLLNQITWLHSQRIDYTFFSSFRPDFRFSSPDQRTVRIRGSPSVTATECSKWAVNDPSADTTVHWSDRTRVL